MALIADAFSSELDFNKESDRLQSFINGDWDDNANLIDSKNLALFGFYLHQKPKDVRCKFCKLKLDFTDDPVDPLEAHKIYSKNCPLISGKPTDNVAIDDLELQNRLPRTCYDCCPPGEDDLTKSSSRFKTFKNWPKKANQNPKFLASAGFVYTGNGDEVQCFCCGLKLSELQQSDDIWMEHEKHNPDCEFLIYNKDNATKQPASGHSNILYRVVLSINKFKKNRRHF